MTWDAHSERTLFMGTIPQPVYIAGPMTYIPQFNFPAFDKAAADLRLLGLEVISPAELDNMSTRTKALASPDGAPHSVPGETWGDFLSRDVKLVADGVGSIAVMDGWEKSRGARLEAFVAVLCKKPVFNINTWETISPQDIVSALLHSIEP